MAKKINEKQEQLSFFDLMFDEYKIRNKCRIIEFFAGVGSQNMALRQLQDEGLITYEQWKICEWAIPSIIAYNQVHHYGENKEIDFENIDLDQKLFQLGISKDYNKPATLDEIKRIKYEYKKQIYQAIVNTNNLVDITKTKGVDLEIEETDKYTYLLTYSFP